MSFHPSVRAEIAAKPLPPLHFDPSVSDSLRRQLGSLRASPAGRGLRITTTLPLGTQPSPEPTVFLYDGRFAPELARLIERRPPALLCALRNGAPSSWELEVIDALVCGRSLPPPGGAWQPLRIGSVATLHEAATLASAHAQRSGGNATVAKLASDVTHELLANALLDAPVDATGAHRYARRRDESPVIAPEDACTFSVACGAGRIALAASDRFGGLTPAPVARAMSRYGTKVQPDTSGGGAGLGMRLILEACDTVVFRVTPGRSTEAMGVIELEGPRRRASQPKSLFYFETASKAAGGSA